MRRPVTIKALEVNDRHPSWSHVALDWLTEGSRLLRELSPQGVIVNGVIPLRTQCRKIAVLHSLQLPDLRPSALHLLAARHLYKQMDLVVCVSRRAAQEARALGIICDEIIPIPVFISRSKVVPKPKRDNVILHVGTRPLKQPLVSVKAVDMLVRMGFEIKLIIVGPANRQTAEILEEYGRCKWLEIRTSVSDIELRLLYSKALALILPSSWESFPYAVLESLSSGTPVVVSDATPEDMVADGITGLRVHGFEFRDYAGKLRTLIEDETWTVMSENARKLANGFEADKIAKIYEERIAPENRDELKTRPYC
jgi:glycosyltransferase involved in cell wall biosynthesis